MSKVKKSVGLIAGGSVIGQVAILLATPVITRLYSPEELGVYALFVSVTGLFSVIISLHYELAIPLVSSDQEAKKLSTIALVAAIMVATTVSCGLYFFKDDILPLINAQKLEDHLLAVPVVLLSSGLLLNKIGIARRNSQFRSNAMAKAAQGIFQPVPQLIAGYYGLGVSGLIIGQVSGLLAGVVCFFNVKLDAKRGTKSDGPSLLALAYRYRNFPLISTAGSMVNALAAQLPVMALTTVFGSREAGFFALSFRVLQGPIRFVGSAISEVFFSLAVTAQREGHLTEVTFGFYRTLVAFGVPTFLVVGAISPEAFALFFGTEWEEAGAYSQYLAAWMFALFVTTPLAILVSVLERQSLELVFQLGYVATIVGSMAIGVVFKSASLALIALGGVGFLLTFGKAVWLMALTGNRSLMSCGLVIKEVVISAPWLIALLAIKLTCGEPVVVMCIAILIMASMHMINYKLRRIYEFR